MQLIPVFLIFGIGIGCVNAQSQDPKTAVRAVIDGLFDAMRAGDGDAVENLFLETATLNSIGEREGTPFMRTSQASDFVGAVGSPHDEVWDERIWDVEINVDGRMASAWVPYAFYLGESFSHCGVNTITFYNGEDGWKIASITDTRRRNDCGIPPEVAGQ